MKLTIKSLLIGAVACLLYCGVGSRHADALPLTFDFNYTGTNGTSATGTIVFDSLLLTNPSVGTQNIAFNGIDTTVTSLSITYAGFANPSYNTTFQLTDFSGMNWDTHNATLDFNQNLIGQTTYDGFGNPDGTWGPGSQGEFSFFSAYPGNPLYPQYGDFFNLVYGGEYFTLGGIQQDQPPVPEPSSFLLLGGGLLGLGLLRKRFKKQ
jgi:hypothetical protein